MPVNARRTLLAAARNHAAKEGNAWGEKADKGESVTTAAPYKSAARNAP